MDLLIAPGTVAYASRDTAPTSGTPGWATDGSPSGPVPATDDAAYQFNAFQEELMNVIEAAGITLDRTNNAQVLAAIRAFIAAEATARSSEDTVLQTNINAETARAEAAESGLEPGRLIQTVSAANTTGSDVAFNFAKPAGATKARIKMIAGGGSGGGSLAPGSLVCSTCSGGGSGAYVFDYIFDVTGSSGLSGTLGRGGQASTGAGNNGTNSVLTGTNISIILPGGGGGAVKQDATSVSFDVSSQGGVGGAPSVTGSAQIMGGMWSAGVPGPCGYLFSGSTVSGQGASCTPFGAGGLNTNTGNGGNATGYGAGGGGAAVQAGGGTVTGGFGTGGFVEIEWLS